jgi:tripartite ATP-independent transporter DctM subunit
VLGIYMFLFSLLLLLVGIPVAFAFGFSAIIFALFFSDVGISILSLVPFRIYGIMQNFTLIAIPLFIFMGLILQKSKIAELMLESIGELFGNIKGGLAISVVLVGGVLGATNGIVGASVVMMSLISLPVMIKYGYSKSLASGVIAASGTLGQIIPPSIILIILGDVLNLSVGDLFQSAIIPSLLLIVAYITYILIISIIKPNIAPIIKSDKTRKEIIKKAMQALIFPSILIFAVLGSIFFGVASPTEASAIGAFGAIILTIINRTFSLEILKYSTIESVKLTAMIFMILIGATAFSLVFSEVGGTEFVHDFFKHDLGSKWSFIIISMLLIFILGFFIDFIEITFVIVPILAPIAKSFGIDLTWFALLIALNLQTSFLSPPFGFALFYLNGSADKLVNTIEVYKGVVPFILLQLLVLAIIIIFPQLVSN